MSTIVDLFHAERETRLRAVLAVPLTQESLYAIRDALLLDSDAQVRSLAARRLQHVEPEKYALSSHTITQWLIDALDDSSPQVRYETLLAIGRLGNSQQQISEQARRVERTVRSLIVSEHHWWVRRAAVLCFGTLATCDEAREMRDGEQIEKLSVLRSVLADPFWRVRYAAIQALIVIGDTYPAWVEQIIAPIVYSQTGEAVAVAAALEHLRAHFFRSGALPTTKVEAHLSESGLFDDADPAVVTANLLKQPVGSVPYALLIDKLADAHLALRQAAVRHFIEGKPSLEKQAALRTALRSMDDLRVPYMASTVAFLLDALGDEATTLAITVLERETSPGALAWALRHLLAQGHERMSEFAQNYITHAQKSVRLASIEVLAHSGTLSLNLSLVRPFLSDGDETVRAMATWALLFSQSAEAHDILKQCSWHTASYASKQALLEHAYQTQDVARMQEARLDAHPALRARAVAALVSWKALSSDQREESITDADPWVRKACVHEDIAQRLLTDSSPVVSRRAMQVLVARRRNMSQDDRECIAKKASISQDPAMRTAASGLLTQQRTVRLERPVSLDGIETLLTLLGDTELDVRAAAVDALSSWTNINERIHAWLAIPASQDALARKHAYTWLLRAYDEGAARLRREVLSARTEPRAVLEHLEHMGVLFGESRSVVTPSIEQERTWNVRSVCERQLGKELQVSPIVLSGVYEPSDYALRLSVEQGVNLFFWEPGYASLTRFFKDKAAPRASRRVLTGTYHADAEHIEQDVHTALRRLRLDVLDVFLLFWARSPNRLNDEGFNVLERLKKQGKIRSFGFSTHHREMALTALKERPWPLFMTRHNAAHRGAEKELFPYAKANNIGVISFSALCYGRLLKASPDRPEYAPSAVDCYRYSLSQPGVSTVISAPRRTDEVKENLNVLNQSVLSEVEVEPLRSHGNWVYEQSQRFNTLVRQAPTDARRTIRSMLLDELVAENAPIQTEESELKLRTTRSQRSADVRSR